MVAEISEDSLYDVIVIGGASAGLTASIYTSRLGLKTLVITKDLGGQALLTDSIQNYPGFGNIGGFELIKKFEEQAKSYGTQMVYDEVVQIESRDDVCFTVETSIKAYHTCALILAFGKTPRDLGVPGEKELQGKGVSYCAICDGPLFKGKDVAVVGSSDPALDAALYLSNLAKRVYIINRLDRVIGSEESIQNLRKMGNIEFITSSTVLSINGSTKVDSVTIIDPKEKVETKLPVDGVFIEMGYVAKTNFVKNLVQLNAKNEIITSKDGITSHPGIFAAGDVTDTPYKQVAVSAGQGVMAALSAYNYLQRLKGRPPVKADWKVVKKAKPLQFEI